MNDTWIWWRDVRVWPRGDCVVKWSGARGALVSERGGRRCWPEVSLWWRGTPAHTPDVGVNMPSYVWKWDLRHGATWPSHKRLAGIFSASSPLFVQTGLVIYFLSPVTCLLLERTFVNGVGFGNETASLLVSQFAYTAISFICMCALSIQLISLVEQRHPLLSFLHWIPQKCYLHQFSNIL